MSVVKLSLLVSLCATISLHTAPRVKKQTGAKRSALIPQRYIFPTDTTDYPLAFPDAKKKFAHDEQAINKAKKAIISFQKDIKHGDLTAYEELFKEACNTMLPILTQAIQQSPKDKTPTIIFDVDETVLSNMDLFVETNFSSAKGGDESFVFRLAKRCTAIKPMVIFCKQLREAGAKLIFISSRRGPEEIIQATRENLINEGFFVDSEDGLYLTPMEVYVKKIPVGLWKESIRKSLAHRYNIIACIGDSETDFTGQYTGNIVMKLPNYLY